MTIRIHEELEPNVQLTIGSVIDAGRFTRLASRWRPAVAPTSRVGFAAGLRPTRF